MSDQLSRCSFTAGTHVIWYFFFSNTKEDDRHENKRTLVCSQIATAFVGKQRFEMDMMARPPGFRTRQTSSITARGFVK